MSDGKRVSIKAIVLGVLTDIGGSFIIGFFIGIIIAIIVVISSNVPPEELETVYSVPIMAISLISGLGMTILGGFVAGLAAEQSEVLHGGLVGVIVLLYAIIIARVFSEFYNSLMYENVLFYVISYGGTIPAALLGGYIAERRRLKKPDARQRDGAYRGERNL